jgi:replicative DNA helicase
VHLIQLVEILKPECFYTGSPPDAFIKAMQGLAIKSLPIDLLTVVEELKLQGRP